MVECNHHTYDIMIKHRFLDDFWDVWCCNHRIITIKSCKKNGILMGRIWDYNPTTLGISWEYHRNILFIVANYLPIIGIAIVTNHNIIYNTIMVYYHGLLLLLLLCSMIGIFSNQPLEWDMGVQWNLIMEIPWNIYINRYIYIYIIHIYV